MTRQAPSGTLARALQVLLLLEALVLGLGLGGLCYLGFISASQWLLLAASLYLGLRLLAVGKNFLQTYRHRTLPDPIHQIGLARTLRLLWGEYYTTLLVYSFLFPFEAQLVPLAPKRAADGHGLPIVLVPGFCCNRGYWALFIHRLRKAGLGPVYALTLEPLFGCIDASAERLRQYVEAICAEAQADKVILVGHSMGGLISRSYLHSGGHTRIAQVICLGTPHEGTVIAHGISRLGENLRQMSCNSEWGTRLGAHRQLPCPVPITAILTPHDNIVAPQASALLHYPNARNVYLPGVGHLEMVLSKTAFAATASAIREQRQP